MTIIEMLEQAKDKYALNCALTYVNFNIESKVTYKGFWDDIGKRECVFWQKGIVKSFVALWGNNSYEWIVTCCAAWKTGCNVFVIDSTWPMDRVDRLLKNIQCKWVFTDKDYLGEYQEYHMINLGDQSYNNAINVLMDKTEISEDDAAVTIFTSGTLSSAKKIVLIYQ